MQISYLSEDARVQENPAGPNLPHFFHNPA